MMEAERRKKKERAKPPGQRRREAHNICGGKKRGGGICTQPKGYGTTHPGTGRCKHHGGASPAGSKAAAKQEAIMMGAPVDINALDALIWCIKITAGEVQFCTQQLEILDEEEWLESTIIGKQVHIWAKERQRAVDRLAKFSAQALSLGIAERAVRMAEQYGSTLAKYTKGILEDLNLTVEQQKQAPLIVRKHMSLLEGGSPVTDEDRRTLPAIPQRVAS
jgi:hypothetical protein